MKKFIILVLVALFTFSMFGCSKKVEESDASDAQLQAVITAAQNYLDSEEFKGYVERFETVFDKKSNAPEIVHAFTFQCDDVNGFALDLILFTIKADVSFEKNGESHTYDSFQVIIDTKDNQAYDSLKYVEERNNFDGTINTYEDAIIGFLNSGVLSSGNNDYFWSELETSTRFTKDNIKTINNVLK